MTKFYGFYGFYVFYGLCDHKIDNDKNDKVLWIL